MGRARGGQPAAGAPRGAGGFDAQVALDRIARRLRRMPAERSALQLAMGQFGHDFDADAWRAAYDSLDPVEMNKVRQVTAGYSELVNHCTEMVRAAVSLGGLRPFHRKLDAPGDYRAFARTGGISKERAETFTRLNTTRNHLAHIYIEVPADEAHKAVLTLLAELPGFTKDYLAWLERAGHELS
jgi:hypothetical protein